jgi:uridine phosphorylase
MSRTLYLRVERGEVGDYVLLTGDPARVDRIAAKLEQAAVIAHNREFYSVTGLHRGRRISAVSSGIGAPSAAIAVEELAQLGVRAVARVGTMMGVRAPLGSLVISTGAARFEGASAHYLPLEFPAVPDWALAQALCTAAKQTPLPLFTGMTATYDAFYPKMAPALVGRGQPDLDQLRAAGVLAMDMETSLLYVLASRLGIAAASLCLVTNEADPFTILDSEKRAINEDILIQTALAGLADWDDRHE